MTHACGKESGYDACSPALCVSRYHHESPDCFVKESNLLESTPNFSREVSAIIVTYHPQLATLAALLRTLAQQVSRILVVDNGQSIAVRNLVEGTQGLNADYLDLEGNLGIATAQNAGIHWARNQGAKFVIFFDQDSLPAEDMVTNLLTIHDKLVASGRQVAAVGPRYLDERNPGRVVFSQMNGFHLIKYPCPEGNVIFPVDFVISSGAMIAISTLDAVGEMYEPFFIDQVDIEWGLRAKAMGYQSFGVCLATMQHALGGEPLKVLGFSMLNHGPLRHYYIFRNAFYLLFKSYTPIGWRVRFLRVIVTRLFIYPVLVAPRMRYLSMMLMGLWHGLIGRMGRF